MEQKNIREQIKALKQEKNAIILAHYYQTQEIQQIADYVGDSFELAKRAKEAKESIIVFCGVKFMAEGAKILSPEKTVLLPVVDAGCPMADMVTAEDVKQLKSKYPNAAVVAYVNSSADVKTQTDICCTSSSVDKIIDTVKEKDIIFIPDKNLGQYIQKKRQDKNIITINGFCPVHERMTVSDVLKAKEKNPNALFAAHPECNEEVLEHADYIGSTSGIINYALENSSNGVIIGTEVGVVDYLNAKDNSNGFYPLSDEMVCKNMKKTTLVSVYEALKNNRNETVLEQSVIDQAYSSLERMMQV